MASFRPCSDTCNHPLNQQRRMLMQKVNSTQIALLLVAVVGSNASCDPGGWITQTTKDGKITVQSKVSSVKDTSGDEFPVIDYKANTVATASFSRCVGLILDVSRHKAINDDKSSEIVETISDHEWIVHYDLKVPWPLPQSDCVAKMTYSSDSARKMASFVFKAAPTRWKAPSGKRMSIYELTYTLRDLGNGRVELASAGKGSPPFKVPQWMLRSGLPGSVSDPLARIVALAGSAP